MVTAGGNSHIHLQLMIPYLLPYQLLISFPYLFENKQVSTALPSPSARQYFFAEFRCNGAQKSPQTGVLCHPTEASVGAPVQGGQRDTVQDCTAVCCQSITLI